MSSQVTRADGVEKLAVTIYLTRLSRRRRTATTVATAGSCAKRAQLLTAAPSKEDSTPAQHSKSLTEGSQDFWTTLLDAARHVDDQSI